MLILGSIAIASVSAAEPPFPTSPTVWAEDVEFVTEANLTCTYFNVSVNVWNVTAGNSYGGVGAWEFRMLYNTTLLDAVYVYSTPDTAVCTDWVPLGAQSKFWPDQPPTINDTFTADYGRVWVGALFPSGSEFIGNGTLVKIKFHISVAPPYGEVTQPTNLTVSSALDLIDADTKLKGPLAEPITIGVEDGSYTYIRPQKVVGSPTAKFSWSPKYPNVGDTVTFDASASLTGDSQIVWYAWDFDGNGAIDKNITTAITTTVYNTAGEYTANLTIANLLGLTDSTPSTDPVESMGQTVKVSEKPAADLDVFTIKSWLGNTTKYRERGKLGGVAGSAFAPGETVTLRSIVTFTDLPVMAVWVGFQLNYPDGSAYASLADVTDVTGNATVSLRLPLVPVTGTYEVSSTARVLEMDVKDTLTFNVDWIITITDVTYPAEVTRGTTASFTVTVESIEPAGYEEYPVVITISVFDYMNQPLGTNSTFDMVIGTKSYELSKFIIDYPNAGYAWPGPGAYVKVNAYTDWPELGGSAYCPEVTKQFTILP